jgi:hypothetical protein
MRMDRSRQSKMRTALLWYAAGALAGCAPKEIASFDVVVQVESDPGTPLAGARLLLQAKPIGESDPTGRVALKLPGTPGDVMALDTACPEGYRSPGVPLSVVLRSLAEDKRPEFRVRCPPLKRRVVLAVRAQHGADLPIRHLGKEIARTDATGAAHASLDVVPGETLTAVLDTSDQPQLMPQHPELKLVVPERDEIVLFDQTFTVRKEKKARRARPPQHRPEKIVGMRRR